MMTQQMAQRQKIIAWCETYGSITNREAVINLGINSPTKRISEIKKSGLYDVQTEKVVRKNSFGKKVNYFKYYISPLEHGKG